MNMANVAISTPKGQKFRIWGRNTNTISPSEYTPRADDFVSSFFAVLNRWKSETRFLSDPEKITAHPSYLALVENAQKIIPLIRMELSREPSHLIWVLEDYFQIEPYAPGDEGDVRKQSNRWLAYLDANG